MNKQIENKNNNNFDITKYAKIKNGTKSHNIDGIYKSSFGISSMQTFLKNASYNGKKILLSDDIIKKLLVNMQNVKNWHLINNWVKCTNQKTIDLNDGGAILQNKIWFCKIDDGTKSPIFTKYTKKMDDAHFSNMAQNLLNDWQKSQNDVDAINEWDAKMQQQNNINNILKHCQQDVMKK